MNQVASVILPLLVFFMLVGYGVWSRKYITRNVVPAGKAKDFALIERSTKAALWLLVLVVILGIAVFKWSTFPKANRQLAIIGVVLITVIAAYNAVRLYYARRAR